MELVVGHILKPVELSVCMHIAYCIRIMWFDFLAHQHIPVELIQGDDSMQTYWKEKSTD